MPRFLETLIAKAILFVANNLIFFVCLALLLITGSIFALLVEVYSRLGWFGVVGMIASLLLVLPFVVSRPR